jgi:hypothetical protein
LDHPKPFVKFGGCYFIHWDAKRAGGKPALIGHLYIHPVFQETAFKMSEYDEGIMSQI